MMNGNLIRPAAFIDRDGTLIEEVNFLSRVEDLQVFAFTAEALRLLKQHGYWIIVVTNQSGIGRGLYTEAAMRSIHSEMQRRLDGVIDAFFHCPHLPESGCRCRKPRQGMIEDANRMFAIDMSRSWFIGDKLLDAETGWNAGIRTAMVRTGYGEGNAQAKPKPDIVADNVLCAVTEMLDFENGIVSGAA